ncbi:addiction module protein [Rubritalea tangerina]|uniref:Addiction module protein n=1 Tax=Rubritalea tangerina TaxID=430798 RepID=A0ABW4Z5X6_9BACT
MSRLSSLEHEVLQLPEDQRITLLNRVLRSSEPSRNSDTDAAWNSEIIRRINLVDSNQTKRIPASEVFSKLEQRLS